MTYVKAIVLAFAFSSVALSDPVLTVRPRFVFKGGTVHLVCKVSRDDANRFVRYGLQPDFVSNRDINGSGGPVFFEKWIEDVGCPGPAEAICEVTRNDGRVQRSAQTVEVKGCADDTNDFDSGSTNSTP